MFLNVDVYLFVLFLSFSGQLLFSRRQCSKHLLAHEDCRNPRTNCKYFTRSYKKLLLHMKGSDDSIILFGFDNSICFCFA